MSIASVTEVLDVMDAEERGCRAALVAIAKGMCASGLSPGRSGNVSCRFRDGMLITPTAKRYEEMTAADMVFVSANGTVPEGQGRPSSEWHFHLAAYAARPDRHALVHTHSLHATALACARRNIPAFHYMVAVAGGSDVPCVPYATFGTEELARYVAHGLSNRDACLMANHGLVALGRSPAHALELAREVETLAAQYIAVLNLGAVHILPDDEMARVLEKFKTYASNAE